MLGAETGNFQQAVRALFFSFEHLMIENELIRTDRPVSDENPDASALYRRNQEIIEELRGSCSRLFDKTDYNFGLCFLYLYFFQRIIARISPRKRSDYLTDSDKYLSTVKRRGTQEQIVVLLTGSKDRTGVHKTAAPVCEDLAGLMNMYLRKAGPFFLSLSEKIKEIKGNRTITFLHGISGTGKSDFLKTFADNEIECRYYAAPSLFGKNELVKLLSEKADAAGSRPFYVLLDDCRSMTWMQKFELRDSLSAVPSHVMFHLICAVRDNGKDCLSEIMIEGYHIRQVEMPLPDRETIRELCEWKSPGIDAEKVLASTLGYPPLVCSCIQNHSDTVSDRVYWNILSGLFEVRSASDDLKLKLAVLLCDKGKISIPFCTLPEGALRVNKKTGQSDKTDLYYFLLEHSRNGLVNRADDANDWVLDPIVRFLFDKAIGFINADESESF